MYHTLPSVILLILRNYIRGYKLEVLGLARGFCPDVADYPTRQMNQIEINV